MNPLGDFMHRMRRGHNPIWFSLAPGHRECEACLKPPSRGKPISPFTIRQLQWMGNRA